MRFKLSDFDPATFGAPEHEHRHHRTRMVISLVAGLAGAVAVLVAGFIIISGTGPGDSAAWVILPALVLVWLSGFWWRWDSPDRRLRRDERERRGY